MRGLRTDRTATVIVGIGFTQNLLRGHYELWIDLPRHLRVAGAFTELMHAIQPPARRGPLCPSPR